MNTFKMILKYWMKSKKDFILEIIYLLISTLFLVFVPMIIGRMIGGLDPNLSVLSNASELIISFSLILLFGFLAFMLERAARLRGAEVSSRAVYYLRTDINNAISRQSFSYFDKTETGQLISRATSDVEESEQIFGMGLTLGLRSILQLGGVTIGFIIFSIGLSWLLLIAIVSSILLSYYLAKKLKPIFLETRNSFGELTNTIRENIVGAQVVRMFNTQGKERQKFSKNNEQFYNASVHSVKLNSFYMPSIYIIIGFMTVFTLLVGGIWVIEGVMNLATLITLQSFIATLGFPLVMLGQIMLMYVQADAALTRVRDVLESTPEVKDLPDATPMEDIKGDVEFENVSFGYTSDHRILKNVSFKIAAGKKLAILGTTGSGKSTIINLIPRFYEVSEGVIKIDQEDIRKYLLQDLRKNVGIVSQETFLFNKSIAANISYGKENATMEEIIEAAKIANLHDFIMSLPKEYDTIVGERGTRLSGGQKQRLSIARALIIKPKILIFDDSTSSVDVETEFEIQKGLEKITKGTTTFIITQRISTIRNADKILVLDKGRVIGFGVHDDLIKTNVLYRQIYETLYYKQKSLPDFKQNTSNQSDLHE